MQRVTVVDAIMGAGKTTWAINYMKECKDENIMYITPFLQEVDRVMTICQPERDFKEPKYQYDRRAKRASKQFSLRDLVAGMDDIVSTHALFKGMTAEVKQLIQENHYTLILDEVLDVVEPYTNITPDDMKILQDSGCISIDEDGFLCWNSEKNEYDTRYNEVKTLSENKCLMQLASTKTNVALLWRYPPEVFSLFDKVYVLTYKFEASIMRYYCDVYGITYEKKSITVDKDGKYLLCDYFVPHTSKYVELIHIYEGTMNTNLGIKKTGLSSKWFDRPQNKDKIGQLKNNIYNYFRNVLGAKSDTILWTTFKKNRGKLRGKGYSKRFLSCSARSTNNYADRYNLVYALNVYPNVVLKKFFEKKDIRINEDEYALSEMIQWIWWSRVRNNESINIYIPSPRMRELLCKWLAL